MDFGGYLRVFRERWLAILLCFLLGIAAAAAITATTTPTYQAGTSLFLKVAAGSGSLYDASQFSVQRVKSYPDLVDSPNVLEPVIRDLNLKTTPQELANRVSATNPIDTVSLRVTAQSTNRRQAAQIANAVAVELSKEVARLESTTTTTPPGKNPKANQSSIELVLTVPARTPQKALTPNRTLNFAVGALGGLAAGLVLAILLAVGDRRLRTAKDVRRAGGLPLIGQLPRGRRGWRPILVRARSEDAIAAYEEIITNVQLVANGRLPRVLVLAPAMNPRKTVDLRYSLGSAAVASGRSALVVEATVEAARSLPSNAGQAKAGLSELLTGSASLSEAVVPGSEARPAWLPLGKGGEVPSRATVDAHLGDLLAELRQSYDLVVVESTPVSRPLELGMLATEADTVVLVAEYAKTHPDHLTRLVAQLEVAHIQPLGVLLISVPRWRRVVVMEEWVPNDISDSARSNSHLHKVADNTASTPPRVPSSSRRENAASPKEELA